jgi:hypothetical protein
VRPAPVNPQLTGKPFRRGSANRSARLDG